MALTPHNDPVRSSYKVPKGIIDNGNCESYLLATLEYSGVIILPIRSCNTICDRCSTMLSSARRYTMIPIMISVIVSVIIVESLHSLCWNSTQHP